MHRWVKRPVAGQDRPGVGHWADIRVVVPVYTLHADSLFTRWGS